MKGGKKQNLKQTQSLSSCTVGKFFGIMVGNVSTPVIGQVRDEEKVRLQSNEVQEKTIISILSSGQANKREGMPALDHMTPLSCHVTSDEPIGEQRRPHNQAGGIRDRSRPDKHSPVL